MVDRTWYSTEKCSSRKIHISTVGYRYLSHFVYYLAQRRVSGLMTSVKKNRTDYITVVQNDPL